MISLRNVEKFYRTGYGQAWVLRRIDLDIAEGEFVTVMGPSGAGKSTLLAILGLLDSEWSGEYHLAGRPVHALKPKERSRLHKETVGFVFQSYHLLDDLTVYENLELPLTYRNVARKDRQSLVADALDRFAIVAKKDLFPSQLSGGQQQLVGVARAVIGRPKLLLADEPTGNLHSAQGEEIMRLFKELNDAGTTIVQVTHSERNAAWSDRVIQLEDGWIVTAERIAVAPEARPGSSAPEARPVSSAPEARPIGSAPEARPGGSAPEAVPVSSAPEARPIGSAPEARPVGSAAATAR